MGSSSHRAAALAFYKNVLESSSDEESNGETNLLIAAAGMVNKQFLMPACRGGSSKKRHANVDHVQEAGHVCLYKDYFDPINPLYKEKAFRRCYRMSRELFLVILNAVREYTNYFEASTIAPVSLAYPLTKNVSRPFGSLHMECQVISLTTKCA
jgi:hypothetical protein